MELLVTLQLRNGSSNDLLNFLELIAIGLGDQKDSTMREEIHFSENDVKGWELIKSLLES
jgi:hypothetical protein